MERKFLFFILSTFVTQSFSLPADICDGTEIFEFIPHPDNCAQYILCLMGTPTIIDCNPNHIYNKESQTCEPGYPETCELLTTTTIYVPTTTIPEETTTTVSEETTTTTIIVTNEPTTLTQETTTITDEPVTTTTTTIPGETTTTTTDPPNLCDGKDYLFVPDPDYCFKFFFCFLGETVPYECAPDQIFSEQSQGCIDGDWETCEPHTTTTEPETTTVTDEPSTTTTTIPEETTTGPPEPCEGTDFGFIPNPDYCFKFYFCNLGTTFPFECAPDKIFNPELKQCFDGDWETCEPHTTTTEPITVTDEPITTTTEEPSTTTPTEVPITTTTTTGDTTIDTERPSTTTTTEYVSTTTTTVTKEPSTTTTEYIISSTTTTVTDEPITITTTTGDTTIDTERPSTTTTTEPAPEITTPSITTSTQRPIGPPELCIGNDFKFIPDPDYCFRYYLCMFGVALPGQCDTDKIFSEKWSGCVLGDWDTCIPENPFVQLS